MIWRKEGKRKGKQGFIAVGMRLGFRGAANAFKGGSTPPPAARRILNKKRMRKGEIDQD